MKKRNILQRFTACMLLLAMLFVSACGATSGNGNDDASENDEAEAVEETPAVAELDLLEENLVDDNYDNYYEIFVYSFKDSDGDGYGDLQGVISELEYIRDLGYTGIWLMPICSSPSYHKYDVADYYTVDELYGTNEDFAELVEAAHALGIKIMIDLVVNHTSDENEWFKEAITVFKNGDTDSQYYDYYNLTTTFSTGYTEYGSTGIYYESRFSSDMPDLNLDSDAVREEITNIMAFWIDYGVDGFRLDAVTSYYTDEISKNTEFVNWLVAAAQELNPDIYIVGEVWEGDGIISTYYEDTEGASYFAFSLSQQEGYIAETFGNSSAADYFWKYLNSTETMSGDDIAALFLDNHDTGRIAGSLGRDASKIKFAYGLLTLLNGSVFTYYGSEIGMVGSGDDPNKRIAMLWSTDAIDLTTNPPGTTKSEYEFDGVAEQLADPTSILSYYKLANNIRNAFPAIARGTTSRVPQFDDNVLVFTKTYNDETITIVINFSAEEQTSTYDGYTSLSIAAELAVDGNVTLDGDTLTLPGYSYAILQ